MSIRTVLITGGAGFIGSHLTDELLNCGYAVRIIDNLSEQVHGSQRLVPDYLNPRAEFIRGDIRDPQAVESAIKGADAVIHLAAAVGVGQSMYEIENYLSVNSVGSAVLLEAVIRLPIQKLLVASSMSIYGEGLYRSAGNGLCADVRRRKEALEEGRWDLVDEEGQKLIPAPTPEDKPPQLSSIYALSKFDQEKMCLLIGDAYDIPTIALRFFNVYGPRQALSNPYTGVLAIFASRYLNGKPPLIFEDGHQRRDFVSVYDVARACRLALESDFSGETFNIGSGKSVSIREVADQLARVMGRSDIQPVITAKYRAGDIRHCFADIRRARKLLGYHPSVSLLVGFKDLRNWLVEQRAEDCVEAAHAELAERGLAR